MRWISYISCVGVLCAFLCGCGRRFVVLPTETTAFIINQGDRIIRARVEPNEVVVPWDGEVVSEGEITRLRQIEAAHALNGLPD